MLGRWADEPDPECGCIPSFDGDRLLIDAAGCPEGGTLSSAPACRATAIAALADREAREVCTHHRGRERVYTPAATALLTAAGRFVDRVGFHDERLACRVRRNPVEAGREAVGRAGVVGRLARETGLEGAVERAAEPILDAAVGLAMARSRVHPRPPGEAVLTDRRDLPTGATVRIYDRPAATRMYHLEPVESGLDATATATLARAHETLAAGEVRETGARGPGRAVRAVASDDTRVALLGRILRKHTRGWGMLADMFADQAVSDVFATAPVGGNPLRVRMDGEAMVTNVHLTKRGAEALASRFRRESGRAFSRASPTLDASADAGDRTIRATGVTAPVSEGLAFAFRAHDAESWTLPGLVANGTLPARAAGLLSLAVDRGANLLVTGARGAGKTTLLGALLWAVPAGTRTLVVEDTPELPVEHLQDRGRDVQSLLVETADGPGITPTDALRTALRLGEGALVLGEVRGPEAAVLYEAMRIGATDGAVMGTIHGADAAAVRERVVTDLDVPASSFEATDAVVTLTAHQTGAGTDRRVATIEEICPGQTGASFATLYDRDAEMRRMERGDSRLFERLAAPGDSYADVRDALEARVEWIGDIATEATNPAALTHAHRSRPC